MTMVGQRRFQGTAAFGLCAFAFAFLIAQTITAAAQQTPAAYMQRVANELIAAQRSGSQDDFARVIRSHADVPSIAINALGSYASSLAKSDRPAYYSGMVNFIARYAATEAPKYPVARAVMTGQTRETASGFYVDSRITLASGTSYDVRWRIVRRGGAFKVRDAEIIGFEMTSFLNTLFQNYISENGGNPRTLVLALNR